MDAALAGYDAPTKAEMDAAFAAIKGAGWTDETLKAIKDAAAAINGLSADTVIRALWSKFVYNRTTRTFTVYGLDGITPVVTGTIDKTAMGSERTPA